MADFVLYDFIIYVLAGAGVGLAIGLTGVGGGSLMTPLLLQFGFPPHVAIGTDLWYATITKGGGVYFHKKNHNIRWKIVALLAAGSLPASIITSWVLSQFFDGPEAYAHVLKYSLGIMLVLTSFVIFSRDWLQKLGKENKEDFQPDHELGNRKRAIITVCMGVILGVFVTLSSVGAGAFCAAILMLLFPLLPAIHVVGTDLAHAVMLTFIAGLSHLTLGNVDFMLLASLLVGSIPATYVGARLGTKLPDKIIRPILAGLLMVLGVKYLIWN